VWLCQWYLVAEPAFSDSGTPRATVCFWREQADTAWRAGAAEPLPEGIVSLLNPQVDISGLAENLAQAGYPVQD
jgi:hypothetical protein